MMKTPTIYEIKAEYEAKKGSNGHFFDRSTMRFFGDTMKNLGTYTDNETGTVYIYRKRAMKPHMPLTRWSWDPETGDLRVVVERVGV